MIHSWDYVKNYKSNTDWLFMQGFQYGFSSLSLICLTPFWQCHFTTLPLFKYFYYLYITHTHTHTYIYAHTYINK